MALSLVTAPATEPLTVSEVRAHLRDDSASGEPAPTAPTVALATIPIAGVCTVGAHRVGVTFVTADGETDIGALSAVVTVADAAVNGQIAVSNIQLGGSAVTQRRLWLTAVGETTAKLAATIANNTATTATLNIADGTLGAGAPTTNTTADPELVAWIAAARSFCETFTHRAFVTQTWDLALDGFPSIWSQTRLETSVDLGAIWLPKPPLVSVTSLSYVDTAGVTQVWAASNYTVDAPAGDWARPGRLVPVFGLYYPVARLVPNAVTVRFVAGYGAAAAVPAPIKAAMKLLIGNWWVNREAAVIARASADVLPFGVAELLWPFKAF